MTEESLNEIYDCVEELMQKGLLHNLNTIIFELDYEELTSDELIAWLTATLPVRSELSARRFLYMETKRLLKKRGQWERGLLRGLR